MYNHKCSYRYLIKYSFVLTDTPNLEENDVKQVKGVGHGSMIGANVITQYQWE